MIRHTFSAEGFEKTDKLQKYIEKKVKDLEKYIPRKARGSAQLTVRITKASRTSAEMYNCKVLLSLPEQDLNAGEKVEHAYASLDVTMAELKRQVVEYKAKHGRETFRSRAARRFQGIAPIDSEVENLFVEATTTEIKSDKTSKKSRRS